MCWYAVENPLSDEVNSNTMAIKYFLFLQTNHTMRIYTDASKVTIYDS